MAIRKQVKEMAQEFTNEPLETKTDSGIVMALISVIKELEEANEFLAKELAEKIDYTLEVNYELFYKTSECKIFNKKITSSFSFTPKSGGYNFGSDRSFDKLYNNSVNQNINNFLNILVVMIF